MGTEGQDKAEQEEEKGGTEVKNLSKFINDQLSLWPSACDNFRALRNVRTRKMEIGGLEVRLQHNPARIVSTAARLDPESLKERRCFLCSSNRPAEQISFDFEGRKGRRYDVLVNPYPILKDHLVIAMKEHCPQSIWRRYVDMLDMARAFHGFVIFYNGPECGASAPDHHHFQAASAGQLPLEKDIDTMFDSRHAGVDCGGLEYLSSVLDAELFRYGKYLPGIFAIRGRTSKSVAKLFYRLLDCAAVDNDSAAEPMCNVFVWYRSGEFRSVVVMRSAHRPHHFFSEGPDHLTISPGCADMAGCVVVPVEAEFSRISPSQLDGLLHEVALDRQAEERICRRLVRTQREVSVGIMSGKEIVFEIITDGAGPRKAVYREGKIEYDGSLYDELFFEAGTLSTMFAEPSFRLFNVTIGSGFHWERKEEQQFAGALKIILDKDMLVAVNVLGTEDYLLSVISSEMKSSAPVEFLKAHAVISRSWLMTQILRRSSGAGRKRLPAGICDVPSLVSYLDAERHSGGETGQSGDEIVRWYGREDHRLFDVCADDHCQRYQGLSRAAGNAVRKAVDETWGQVLAFDGHICDTRFSKCCGGVMEKFSSCWEDTDHPYLRGISDTVPEEVKDLSDEKAFRAWLASGDDGPFCSRADAGLLSSILNSYDMETADFYRWQEEYGRQELSDLFRERSGIDVGEIQALEPVSRGVSGRIVRLRVSGSERTVVIGKELEIRRVLSSSHLKSSAFAVDYIGEDGNVIPQSVIGADLSEGRRTSFSRIRLSGAGWGHGVGLCQIGAAVMASEGCGYGEILKHYYPGSELMPADKTAGYNTESLNDKK